MTRRLLTLGVILGFLFVPVFGADLPRKAPEFAVALPDGQQALLSQYKGKVVLMAFVHTTCPHCQKASMVIENLYKELGPKGFQPIDVAFNENAPQLVPDFIKQVGLTYPTGTASRDQVLSFLQLSLVEPFSVPQIAMIDRKGMIRYQFVGDDLANLRSQIETLLKEPAGAARRTSKSRAARTASTAHR